MQVAAVDEVIMDTLGAPSADVAASLIFACTEVVPRLRRTTDEIAAVLHALDGGYVPAGPSGSPLRGLVNVLPTGRTARFASGLSVFDFLKRTTWVQADRAALGTVGPAAVALAEAEGLHAHARSIAMRLNAAPA